jgi:hypothetical protein
MAAIYAKSRQANLSAADQFVGQIKKAAKRGR